MRKIIDSAVKKSRLSSSFLSHFLVNADDVHKKNYLRLLSECYKFFGYSEKREEFICKIFNTLNVKIDEDKELIDVIKDFDFESYGRFFFIDLFILASLGKIDIHTLNLIKALLSHFNCSKNFAESIYKLVKFVLQSKEWRNYSELVNSIITDEYIVEGEVNEKDKIFLNCRIEFLKESSLKVNKSQFFYFINCKLVSPKINITNTEFVKLLNCEISEKFEENSFIKISDVYSLEITNNRIINLKNPYLINTAGIQYFKALDNKYKIFSDEFNLWG